MKQRMCMAALAGLVWHGTVAASDAPDWNLPVVRTSPIVWSVCQTPFVTEKALLLGDRLRCGRLSVPRDHHDPDAGHIEVAVIRVSASQPSRRRGAIFFNPGGPGISPVRSVPTLAQYWDGAYADHPVHGTKKQLAEQFDLIGVVPRGLDGGTRFECVSDSLVTDHNDIIADSSAANVQAMDRFMRATASACRSDPLYRFINTEQTVYDMEAVRLSLGEPSLNFYGISYGTWLGSWYAAAFPEHVGRMVLDSNMDWTADFDTNLVRLKSAYQEHFDRTVAGPAANDRFRYGLGADVSAVTAQLGHLHYGVRHALGGAWRAPEDLLAALAVSDWLRDTPDMSLSALVGRAMSYRFHTNEAVNAIARRAALRHSWRFLPVTRQPEPFALSESDAIYSAVMCNDTPYAGDAAHHQAKIAALAEAHPAADGRGLQYHCVYWDGPHATRPPLSRMAAAGDVLMVQAEYDPITPLQSAVAGFQRVPTTHLIVADGLSGHGVFGFTDSACVEDAVGRYLLRGSLPMPRMSHCGTPAASDAGTLSAFVDPQRASELRAELSSLRSTFAR